MNPADQAYENNKNEIEKLQAEVSSEFRFFFSLKRNIVESSSASHLELVNCVNISLLFGHHLLSFQNVQSHD